MRITELLEGKRLLDFEDFITKTDNNEETLDYDLTKDLIYFMNHDDQVYRNFVYPSVSSAVDKIKQGVRLNPLIFKTAVVKSYQEYIKRYKIRILPDSLSNEQLLNICKEFYETLVEHIKDKRYD